jgi:hypothetical protein
VLCLEFDGDEGNMVILVMRTDMRIITMSYFKTRHQKESEGTEKKN